MTSIQHALPYPACNRMPEGLVHTSNAERGTGQFQR